jgi:hypothetical protein
MNKKIKLSIISGILALSGFFIGGIHNVSAQYVVQNCNSATLSGYVNPNGNPTIAWFEWGPTSALGEATPSQTYTSYQSFSYTITGLSEKTTYYYEAKFRNAPQGEWSGSPVYFSTPACAVVVTPAPTVSISANPTSVSYGGSSTISWSSTNATSCVASGSLSGTEPTTSSQSTGPLTGTQTYTITCTGAGGSASNSATVTVSAHQSMSGTLTLNPSSCLITSGNSSCSVNLSWDTTNPQGTSTITESPNITVGTGNSGNSSVVIPYSSQSFYLYNNSTLLDQGTATSSCTSGTSWNGSVCSNNTQTTNPTANITALNTNLAYGGSTDISWSSADATSCIGNGFNTNNNPSGNVTTGALDTTTTYSVTCYGASGTTPATDSITVDVNGQQNQLPTVTLTADNSNLSYGGSTYLRWSSTNATSCVGTNFSTNNNITGNFQTGALYATTTYNINCTGSGGTQSASVTLFVNNNAQTTNPTANITTLSTNLTSGDSTYISWSSTNATSCVGNGFNTNNNTSSSIDTGALYGTTTYSVTCYGASGTTPATDSVTVYVNNTNNYGCTYNCYTYQQQPSVTTYSATNITGTSATLNGYVSTTGGYNTTTWFQWGTNTSYLSSSTSRTYQTYSGSFSDSSLYNLSPNTLYYYQAVAQTNNGQIVYGNILNFETSYNGNIYNNNTCNNNNSSYYYNNSISTCAPTAVTTMATSVTQSSAILSGLGLVNNNAYTTGYFEYGTTQSLGSTTPNNNNNIGNGTSNPFYANLSNLASGVPYYYRAVVTNQYGTSRGDILSFTTIGQNNNTNTNTNTRTIYRNTTIVTNGSTGTSKSSLVSLSISGDGQTITRGSTVQYVVDYKNISSQNLQDVIIQIYIPKELQFVNSSMGDFSPDDNTLVADIGNLNPQQEGNINITTNVTPDAQIGKIIVVSANAEYTIASNNTQQEVFAYAKNTIEDGGGTIQQGALAFIFGNGFFPSTLIGWLLLILLISLLILAGRKAYYRSGPIMVHNDPDNNHH